MIRVFQALLQVLLEHGLDRRGYKVVIQCDGTKSKSLLEMVLKEEFNALSKDPNGHGAPRFDEGSILGIPFKLTL